MEKILQIELMIVQEKVVFLECYTIIENIIVCLPTFYESLSPCFMYTGWEIESLPALKREPTLFLDNYALCV